MTNLDSVLKSRDITLPTEVRLVKAMVFPQSCMDVRVVMYGCESWTVKIANTLLQQHTRRTYTWTAPDGQYRNLNIFLFHVTSFYFSLEGDPLSSLIRLASWWLVWENLSFSFSDHLAKQGILDCRFFSFQHFGVYHPTLLWPGKFLSKNQLIFL